MGDRLRRLPTWSPGGQAVAFAAHGNQNNTGSALYVVNTGGSGLSVVPNTGKVWNSVSQPQ